MAEYCQKELTGIVSTKKSEAALMLAKSPDNSQMLILAPPPPQAGYMENECVGASRYLVLER
jgi:hypothetical protein